MTYSGISYRENSVSPQSGHTSVPGETLVPQVRHSTTTFDPPPGSSRVMTVRTPIVCQATGDAGLTLTDESFQRKPGVATTHSRRKLTFEDATVLNGRITVTRSFHSPFHER